MNHEFQSAASFSLPICEINYIHVTIGEAREAALESLVAEEGAPL